jgi:nitrate/nitrite-specific signal transduction histidine kinase
VTIANRILLGFAAITILLVVVGLYGLSQIAAVREQTETIVARDLAVARLLETIRGNEEDMRATSEQALSAFLLRSLQKTNDNRDFVATWQTHATATEAAISRAISLANEYRTNAVSGDRSQAWTQISATLSRLNAELTQINNAVGEEFRAIRANDANAAVSVREPLAMHRETFRAAMAQGREILDSAIAAGQDQVRQVYETSRISVIAALAVAVALGILVTFLIRMSIVRPLAMLMSFVGRVGEGDLAGQRATTGKDELGQLGGNMNVMVDGLRQLARQAREATENLNAATAEIRASTQEQAAGVEEQLAAVQETAATVDQITHAGTQISKRAQEVIASAQAAAQTSKEGLRAVDETGRAMDAIREQA